MFFILYKNRKKNFTCSNPILYQPYIFIQFEYIIERDIASL